MADIEYYEESPSRRVAEGVAASSAAAVVVNWIGAILSVSLVVGLSVWAWQLTVRDVSGVPVIRALEGPMRVAPENPGGTVADHQGLAVNRITEGEEAAPAAERIVLAPAPLGAWLTSQTEILRVTRNLVFGQGLVYADDTLVARVNGVFKIGESIAKLLGDADLQDA